jgi:hypothetical protein
MHTLIPTENGEFKTYQKLRNLNEPGVPKAFFRLLLNKLKRIQNIRLPPKTVKQVRSFIGMVNFYRKFIPNFSHISAPLTRLTKKDVCFISDSDFEKDFETLKQKIVEDVVLNHPDVSNKFCIFTDASDFAVGAVLTQEGKPVEFYSRKLLDAELNYTVFDKELLAIVDEISRQYYFS